MTSLPQHSAHVPSGTSRTTDPSGTDLELYREKFRRRLPESLGELKGPGHGVVEPPVTVVWSGLRAFDLANERQRMSLYRIVIAEGMREDLCALLNQEILLQLWPTLRTLVSTTIRSVWEDRFPDLRALANVPPVRPPARLRRANKGASAA
ncbi:hypothetical protein QMA61_15925 [Streptomyces coelicoflavus]|uniref:hypothetical protein n=1 Tax=Streptomyces coelicoflavus TaxID=285562 RepID=UPI0024AC94EA|nr:hypothetical protein [Streptomyces coelicoflavus]MDI6517690.1 hypothetical protein [Streptomyces coelicoflavus]